VPPANRNGGNGEIGRNTTMLMTVGWDFTFTDGHPGPEHRHLAGCQTVCHRPGGITDMLSSQSMLLFRRWLTARETISVDLVNATPSPVRQASTAAGEGGGIKIEKEISLQPNETRTWL